MPKEIITEKHYAALGRYLAEIMESLPVPLVSAKYDRPGLVTKIETLGHLIEAYAVCTAEFLLKGNWEELGEGIEVFSRKFAEELGLSAKDGRLFCLLLTSLSVTYRTQNQVEELAGQKAWTCWMQQLWEKEG